MARNRSPCWTSRTSPSTLKRWSPGSRRGEATWAWAPSSALSRIGASCTGPWSRSPAALEALRGELRAVSQSIKEQEARLREVEEALERILLLIPNVPHESVPVGAGAEDNVLVRTWGEKPTLLFTPRQHFELGERLG